MQHRLYELRMGQNITQQRLAIELGIDQTSISSYECGKYLPTVEVLIRLARYFQVSTDYLLGLSDIKTPMREIDSDQTAMAVSVFSSLPPERRERALGYLEGLRDG